MLGVPSSESRWISLRATSSPVWRLRPLKTLRGRSLADSPEGVGRSLCGARQATHCGICSLAQLLQLLEGSGVPFAVHRSGAWLCRGRWLAIGDARDGEAGDWRRLRLQRVSGIKQGAAGGDGPGEGSRLRSVVGERLRLGSLRSRAGRSRGHPRASSEMMAATREGAWRLGSGSGEGKSCWDGRTDGLTDSDRGVGGSAGRRRCVVVGRSAEQRQNG